MTILIIGRSGTGKDYVAELLKQEGLKVVTSSTTRKPRYPGEDKHIFLTEEEAAAIPAEDIVAETVINGFRYFATRQQVEESDIYIVDPKGFYELTTNMPDTPFCLMYVKADPAAAKEHAIARAKDKEKEVLIYEFRKRSEDQQFSDFEALFADPNRRLPENVPFFMEVHNDYTEHCMDKAVQETRKLLRVFKKTQTAVRVLRERGWLMLNENGRLLIFQRETSGSTMYSAAVSDDIFAARAMQDKAGLGSIMSAFLAYEDTSIALVGK